LEHHIEATFPPGPKVPTTCLPLTAIPDRDRLSRRADRPAEAVVTFAPEVWGAALRCITGSKAHTSDCAKSSRNSPPHLHGPSRYEAFLALALVELQNEVLQLRLKGGNTH
jgi:hypothetical protein